MGLKKTRFGKKMKRMSIRRVKLSYTDMFRGRNIYLRYIVISIVLITVIIATELFYLTIFLHSLDVTFSTYLSISLTCLQFFSEKF